MIGSVAALSSPQSPFLSDPATGAARAPPPRRRSLVVCSSERSSSSIPKLKPFSRSRTERWIKDPPFLQKRENELTEYCTTLEGDDSCSCWRACFELKDLEKQMPGEDVERFVRQAGGLKSLISCLHGITAMLNKKEKQVNGPVSLNKGAQKEKPFPVPDGIPKAQEELDEEERARMPDSAFTRLLRSMGKHPDWYSQAPDHETD